VEVKKLTIDTSVTFDNLLGSKKRVTQHIGGTRSGKTYAILQHLIVRAIQEKLDITVVRRTVPSLKRSVIKDFKDILTTLHIWETERYNISDRIFSFGNGSTISFINTDDPEKLRGVKSNILFIDEASEIDEESYFQLSIRCTGDIILAYNPTISPYHWLRQMEDCERFTTTYKDNPYLPKEMIKAIEDLEAKNPKYWLIYGKGEFAPNDSAIFTFQIIDEMPVEELIALGMDFGFSNDPTAIVAVHKKGDMLYVRELLYEKGMVTKDIINKLDELNVGNTEIWADSAEPRLIEEIYRSGFNIKPVKKGPDSIKFGIGVLQNYGLCVERSSQNLVNELYAYEWSKDKYGIQLDKPQGGLDHLIDSLRYVAMSRLSIKAENKGKYTLSFR
jgi:phage terminase large subunit